MLQRVYDLITTWQKYYGSSLTLARLAELLDSDAGYVRAQIRLLVERGLISPQEAMQITGPAARTVLP